MLLPRRTALQRNERVSNIGKLKKLPPLPLIARTHKNANATANVCEPLIRSLSRTANFEFVCSRVRALCFSALHIQQFVNSRWICNTLMLWGWTKKLVSFRCIFGGRCAYRVLRCDFFRRCKMHKAADKLLPQLEEMKGCSYTYRERWNLLRECKLTVVVCWKPSWSGALTLAGRGKSWLKCAFWPVVSKATLQICTLHCKRQILRVCCATSATAQWSGLQYFQAIFFHLTDSVFSKANL